MSSSASSAKDSYVVKIAVEMPDQVPQLIEFNQKQPLDNIIQDLCNGWNLTDSDQYALQFNDNTNRNYITEKNRMEIKNGSVLRLQYSPMRSVQDILQKLQENTSTEPNKSILDQLTELSTDFTFAEEFINQQGLVLIVHLIEEGNCGGSLLMSFVELMEHDIVSWDVLSERFINRIVDAVVGGAQTTDAQTIQASLAILENVVLNSADGYNVIESKLSLISLVGHLHVHDHGVQQNVIALLNAFLQKSDTAKRRQLTQCITSKQVRTMIQTNILQTGAVDGAEMAHQLYVLQTLLLAQLQPRMCTKLEAQDQDSHDKIKELRRIAFDGEHVRGVIGVSRNYKKLGFKNDINPAVDFTETPPGLLALDCMVYFARAHPENYTKLVLENSCRTDEHECPFGRAGIELVKIICDVLKIGEPPSEQGVSIQPLFFTHDHPFEECFCICIGLLNKTWKEMRATLEDFGKVVSVVREQIVRALDGPPASLEHLKTRLQMVTYREITQLWQSERTSREEWKSHARPIVELREKLKPDIRALIRQQRLTFLVEGTRFTKYSARGQRIKNKFWYMRLSPNYKVLHYGDCDERAAPTTEELPSKLAVGDVKCLVVGRDCPHMRGRKASYHLAFSMQLEEGSNSDLNSVDCVAPDELAFAYWTDGVNALLNQPMDSKEAEKDLDTLLSMEIKLRLLNLEGVSIPDEPPPIPPDPTNLDFCYNFK